MSELDAFLAATEGSVGGISKTVNRTIEYPFIYIKKITNVELSYLAGNKVLFQNKPDDDYIPLYLKTESGSYKFLGYVLLCFTTLIKLNYLAEHEIILKVSKEQERVIVNELFDSLLLTR